MEYGEMMRQFAKFCAAQEEIAEQAGMDFQCEGCPLEKNSVCDNLPCAVKPEDVERAERVVERWAQEHPEPVYPTWGEWLAEMGLFKRVTVMANSRATRMVVDWGAVQERIPAEEAIKLGVKPVAEKRVCGGIA